jgi:methyl-accepting chemotaxis protein
MFQSIRKSIDRRITFFVALVITISIGLIGILVYRFLYDKTIEQLEQTALLQTKSISAEVEDLFENGSIVAEQLSYNKEVKKYLYEVKSKEDIYTHPLYKEVRSTLVETKENTDYFSTIWIANISANFYFDDIGNASDDTYAIKKRPWYDVAVNSHDVAFSKAYTEWSTGETVLSSIKALRDSGEIYGFVAVDITLDSIPEVFYNHRLGYGEEFYLISETGDYVYHPEIVALGQKSILQEEDLLRPYKRSVFQGSGVFEEVEINGKSMYLLSYPVELANWRVVTLIDQSVLFSEIRGLFSLLVVMMLITLIIATIIIRYIVKNQMTPFRTLVNFGNDITEGNLNRNIPHEYLERQDDMGDLSRSFQLIINAFKNEKVTLEKHIEEKNKALKEQYDYILETEKAASLGGVVSGIAHEINTPLGNSVTSLSYLSKINDQIKTQLLDGKLSRDDLVDYIQEVDKAIGLIDGNLLRSVELVENFKLISINQDDALEKVNICNLISMVAVSLKHDLDEGRHRIQNNCMELIELESYSGAWIQIFTNLIQNSLQHGFSDRTEGLIDIEGFVKDHFINIIYKDNGLGMSRETLKNIYEPFFTTSRSQGNVGLGMSIVFNLVNHKLNGSIKVTSFKNKGVTILIKVPRK